MSSKQRVWNTPFTKAFQCRLPIISAPMAGVSGGLLASEVTKAGGLGIIAAGHFQDVTKLESEIKIFEDNMIDEARSQQQNRSLAIGFIGFSSLASSSGWENYEYILSKYKPKAVQFFAPSIIHKQDNGPTNVQFAHKHGVKFIAQVGSIKDVKLAIQHEVDGIICQGSEAGGHGLRRELGNSAMALASQASKLTDIPILSAGGVVNGKHLASALCYCDGVSIGTRYWASSESLEGPPLQDELIKENSCDDILRTAVFDHIHNEIQSAKWPHPFNSTSALRNQTTEEWDGKPQDLQRAIENTNFLEQYIAAKKLSDKNVVPVLAGEGVGEIESIEGAYQITLKIEEEAIGAIEKLKSIHGQL